VPCLAPSEFLTGPTSATFGAYAESVIQADYLRENGRLAYYPASPVDFKDISHGFGNTSLYVAFLRHNNPSVSQSELLALSFSGLLKIPDIATHDPATGRHEFYEIKPNSIDGRAAGFTKVAMIDAANTSLHLPYRPGIRYSPNRRLRIYSGMPLGARLDVYFHFQRVSPGLLVYDICAEGEFLQFGIAILLAILAMIILIVLRGRGLIPPEGGMGPVPVIA
jgi:hypothetical protein